MKRDNNSGRKSIPNRKMLIAGGIVIAISVVLLAILIPKPTTPETITLSEVAAGVSNGSIVKIEDTASTGDFKVTFEDGKTLVSLRDPRSSLLEQLSLLGVRGDKLASVHYEINQGSSAAGSPSGIVLALLLIGIPVMLAIRLTKSERWGKKSFQEVEIPATRFCDVAGLDDNLTELQDIVTFLKEGNRYADMGAKMPRGILMVGDPGTGKTLLARAVAGEAGVPFYATSGSEFTEVFVGVGASRIRSLFQKAKKKAPCIVFIDEIDAVGRSRHKSESGAEMEQDQTLNQLLVEMDGFTCTEGVIVLAATNRVDVLDSALTRPGRFDRQVYIDRPDVKGRESILKIHVGGKKLAPNVELSNIAKATPGLVGADLANIVNEAAICAVRNGHLEIHMTDFEEATEKIITGGVQRKNHVMSEDEKKIVAYHEAGHAVIIHETKLSDPVYKVSIIPRGQMGGFTMSLPEEDRTLMSRCRILSRITGLLGGRAAEEIFFQDVTTGASNDLNVATQLAEEMVMRLGMDANTGLRVFPHLQGRFAFSAHQGSQKTFETIDEAVNNILHTCYNDARQILIEKRQRVERVANELLEQETIDREQFLHLMAN